MNLVRAALRKITSTSTWWIFGLITLAVWALALLQNYQNWVYSRYGPTGESLTWTPAEKLDVAGGVYTNGQLLGMLLAMLFGAILITNEFQQLTATTTFLLTPRRAKVMAAKLVAAALGGLAVWATETLCSVIGGPFVLSALKIDIGLGEPGVWRVIGLNALAFTLWALVGMGAGALLRNQLAATLTLTVVYLLGLAGAESMFDTLATTVSKWFDHLRVVIPTTASDVMIFGHRDLPGHPSRWAAGLILVAYALVMGLIGTRLIRRRDVD
jgi:ABC-2 type transport system permease protein